MAFFNFGSFEPKSQKEKVWFVSAVLVLAAGFFSLGASFSFGHSFNNKPSNYRVKFQKEVLAFRVENKEHRKIVLVDKPKAKKIESNSNPKNKMGGNLNHKSIMPIYKPQLNSPSLTVLYQKAGSQFGIDWRILAAIHLVESGQAIETYRISYAGAQGPMQFLAQTFNYYAIDGDGDGIKNIYDVDDAVFTAAHLLASNNASSNVRQALFSYNHSWDYVDRVLAIANSL